MKKILFLITLITIGCSSPKEKSQYQKLTDYQGHYEYVGETTLDLVASEFDTTLYAILDNSKYPLKHVEKDSFVNIRNKPVVFERDEKGKVLGYKSDGQYFKLLNRNLKKLKCSREEHYSIMLRTILITNLNKKMMV